ncbi:MAG: DUF2868 domain-containing protein [Burkholderiaceae bacterium]|nr:DUF2868 domain-containing protein [Burkholderiaceae bacterium]
MDEAAARRVVLLQAFDAADSPLWTREDAAWATQLAARSLPADAPLERLLSERARHAVQRLEPRDRAVRRWLGRPGWRWRWVLLAVVIGLAGGFGVDLLGRNQIVDVLAPGVWAVVAWNLAVYLLLAFVPLGRATRGDAAAGSLRRALLSWWQHESASGPLRIATRRWAELSAGLALARIAVLLHVAAAALAIGLLGGMYLRGLVLDYRAGWQSTFLDATQVHTLLAPVLSPAGALIGIPVPDASAIEAMRLSSPAQPATAPAAPWIHLYAATLVLAVVMPRLLLALAALVRALLRARRIEVPLTDVATQREVRLLRRQKSQVRVCPYAQSPSAQAALGLRALLRREFGDDLQLDIEATTAVGDEDEAARRLGAQPATVRVVLVDLAATPEEDHQGRFVRALQSAAPQVPLLVVCDESAYRQRFAGMPERIDERRGAWRRWAASHDVRLSAVALDGLEAALVGDAPRAPAGT